MNASKKQTNRKIQLSKETLCSLTNPEKFVRDGQMRSDLRTCTRACD